MGGLEREGAPDQLNLALMSATFMRDQLDAPAEPGYQRRDGTRFRRRARPNTEKPTASNAKDEGSGARTGVSENRLVTESIAEFVTDPSR
jgi:hypothetical protein